jgi:FixJ family two-component response regulator
VDRSSRPHHLRKSTPEATVERAAALRRQRYTGKQIAAELKISPATERDMRAKGMDMQDKVCGRPLH